MKVLLTTTLFSTLFHYKEALTSLQPPRGAAGGGREVLVKNLGVKWLISQADYNGPKQQWKCVCQK